MSEIRDCINCENYRYWLEIQLTDDAGQPLDNLPVRLTERGTGKSAIGTTDGQGLFRAEGLSARPFTLSADAQILADRLAAEHPGLRIQFPADSLVQHCRAQKYLLSQGNQAGAFSPALPGRVYDMSASQISRLCDYAAPQEGYPLIWPYNHRRVIAIRRISEKVYAKSVRRGAGNTDAGTEPERLDNFGCYRSSYWDADEQPLQAGFALPVFEKAMEMVMAGHAQKSLSEFQNSQRDKNDLFSEEFPQSSGRSATSQRNLMLTLLKSALPVGMMVANYYDGDSLTYEDLAEKADSKGTATTRVRIKFGGNVLTGAPEPVSYATKGSNDQVRVRRGVKAPEYEAEEIRNSSKAYRSSDGLPTPQSLATIYKFELDDGNILYLGVDTDNKFVELTSVTHPDEFGGRGWHTGGDIDTVDVPTDTGNQNPYLPGRPDSSGGFQAQENGPVILTNPAPDEQGFNDYILITPVADIPAIYVYLSEKGKRTKNRLPEGKNGDTGPVNEILEKRHPETNELQQLRKYDHEGKPIKDIDFGHNHGAGDPHAHDWVYPSEQAPNKIRLDGRPLRTGETIND